MITPPILTTSLRNFSIKGWENILHNLRVTYQSFDHAVVAQMNECQVFLDHGKKWDLDGAKKKYINIYEIYINPFTPESDQCQNSPAASQEI